MIKIHRSALHKSNRIDMIISAGISNILIDSYWILIILFYKKSNWNGLLQANLAFHYTVHNKIYSHYATHYW